MGSDTEETKHTKNVMKLKVITDKILEMKIMKETIRMSKLAGAQNLITKVDMKQILTECGEKGIRNLDKETEERPGGPIQEMQSVHSRNT